MISQRTTLAIFDLQNSPKFATRHLDIMSFGLPYNSDPLTITCPDNTTYWLVLFVNSQDILQYKAVYYAAVVVETAALIVGFAQHLRAFARFWRLKAIHVNFMLITALLYVVMVAGAIGRICMILYETKLIPLSDCIDTPLLLLGLVHQASLVHPFPVFYAWTIERSFATLFVADYEKQRRLHISLVLISLILTCDFVFGYMIVTGVVSCFLFTICAFVPIVICTIAFRLLIHCNNRRLTRLTHHIDRHNDEYSLSLRVQLNENIWSLQKIQFGIYIIAGGIAVLGVMIFAPILNLTASDQTEMLQFMCAANLGFAIFICLAAPWLEVAIAVHTGKESPILSAFLCRKNCKKSTKVLPMKDGNEIDVYFNQLEYQWIYGLNYRTQGANNR